jgi:6-methylsalicylate decarboxylase
VPATDLHQHLWPDALLRQLARRTAPPRLRRDDRGWILELAGEPPAPADLAAHEPVVRILQAEADAVDRVVVAPSTPLGIEALPAREAQPLLDAFHAGVLELGAPFRLWASVPLAAPAADEVGALLDTGAAGLCLPAEALASPEALDRAAPLLEPLIARDAPLLVHPGPAGAGPYGPGRWAAAGPRVPAWWPAMTSYVAAMQAAWLAWAQWGRAAHPRLKVVWAMLAGCAPLHAERLTARGGPAQAVHDDRAWFDVSSYGPKAVDAMLRVVGVDRLVLGSDRPVVDPPSLAQLGPAVRHAVARANPAQVLT